MQRLQTTNPTVGSRRAFTLVEALVAITLLLVIILFTAKIFSSVSDVATAGQANADVMQEVAAIEDQIRRDFDRITKDGYFAIVSTAVRNDINDPTSTNPDNWLDPSQPFNAFLRSDRLVFFTQGTSTTQVYRGGQEDRRKPQSTENRVYYGHGFQLASVEDEDPTTTLNVDSSELDVEPWRQGSISTLGGGSVDIIQPEARLWTFVRQNVLLADDGGSVTVFGSGQGSSTASIWDNEIRNSRVDAAASRLDEIRENVTFDGSDYRPWPDMVDRIQASVFYPRAERTAPTMIRDDHALTVSTLGSAVSNFAVDWTYHMGLPGNGTSVGFVNPTYTGIEIPPEGQQPWFGLPDSAVFNDATPARGVAMLQDEDSWEVDDDGPILPTQFEFADFSGQRIKQYTVVFGYNTTQPLDPTGSPWSAGPADDGVIAFTPWPDAIRITMRLHDTRTTLEGGREVQFVVQLPERVQ